MFVCVCLFVCLSAHLPAFVEKMKLHLALQDWDQSMEAAKRYVMFVCVSLSVCLSICIYICLFACVWVCVTAFLDKMKLQLALQDCEQTMEAAQR